MTIRNIIPVLFAIMLSACTPILDYYSLSNHKQDIKNAQNMEEVMKTLHSGDKETAFRQMQALAENGNAEAQFEYSHFFLNGSDRTPQDYGKAIEWLEKSAAQGNVNAQFNLGVMYDKG